MKRKLIIIALLLALALIFVSCSKTDESSSEQVSAADAISSEIIEDLTGDVSELSERERTLLENINDVEMLDFTLPDFEGNEHSLSDYKGQIIILNFWAVGCPPCVNELPDFSEVAERDGVVLVTVAQNNILGNEKKASYEFIKDFNTVALWDEKQETVSVYPSQYYPHTYIIDRQGIIRFVANSLGKETLNELVTFCDENFN